MSSTRPSTSFLGEGHNWRILVRVTPQAAQPAPVYFYAEVDLPPVPETKMVGSLSGGYLLGEGRYDAGPHLA